MKNAVSFTVARKPTGVGGRYAWYALILIPEGTIALKGKSRKTLAIAAGTHLAAELRLRLPVCVDLSESWEKKL